MCESVVDQYFSKIKNYLFLFSVFIALLSVLLVFSANLKENSFNINLAIVSIFFILMYLWLKIFYISVIKITDIRITSFYSFISKLELNLFPLMLLIPIYLVVSAFYANEPLAVIFGAYGGSLIIMICAFVCITEGLYNSISTRNQWYIAFISFILIAAFLCFLMDLNQENPYTYLALTISFLLSSVTLVFLIFIGYKLKKSQK